MKIKTVERDIYGYYVNSCESAEYGCLEWIIGHRYFPELLSQWSGLRKHSADAVVRIELSNEDKEGRIDFIL